MDKYLKVAQILEVWVALGVLGVFIFLLGYVEDENDPAV